MPANGRRIAASPSRIVRFSLWSALLAISVICAVVSDSVASPSYPGSLYFFNSAANSILKMDMKTMRPVPINIQSKHFALSPDGKRLVYMTDWSEVGLYELSTGSNTSLGKDRLAASGPLFWSNDRLAYLRETKSSKALFSSPPDRLDPQPIPYELPKYRTDSLDFISFGVVLPSATDDSVPTLIVGGHGTIYIIGPSEVKVIYRSEKDGDYIRSLTASPDGKKLAFTRDLDEGIWVINTDGTELRKLVSTSCTAIAWSPDNRYIAFVSTNGAVRGNLYQSAYSDKTWRGGGAFTYAVWIMTGDGRDIHPLSTDDGKKVSVMGSILWGR